ncbi:MAG TPA: phosphate ABC transporter permease PstA [Actinomycetaceae bacterium]|nr:phosphate ABC transporter permease PstA [Actinomycetaceae bacterium]
MSTITRNDDRKTTDLQAHRLPSWVTPAAFVGAFALGALITQVFGGFDVLGASVVGVLAFLVVLYGVSYAYEGRRWAADRMATSLVYLAFLLVMLPLVSLLYKVLVGGIARFDWQFLSTDMVGIYGEKDGGGALHAIIGTLLVTGIAALIAIPLGVFTAIYLVEYRGGRIGRAVTFLVDVMTGIPSIVAGLFAFSLFFILVSPGYKAGIIGAVALAVLMTPVVVRGSEEMLKLVPNELREASYALGVPKWLTITKVVLRTAIAGITTSVMIAIARVAGETAPLLITIGIVANVNTNPFEGRMTTLPVFVFRQYAQGGTANTERAWAAALALIIIVMLLNLLARLVSRYFSPKGIS